MSVLVVAIDVVVVVVVVVVVGGGGVGVGVVVVAGVLITLQFSLCSFKHYPTKTYVKWWYRSMHSYVCITGDE
jgi:hypothetical protein